MYKLTTAQSIARLSDGASIPNDLDNNDCKDYRDWLAKGNTPLPADIPPPPTPLAQIRALEQKHDDDQRKITRISILEMALDKACANPAMAGKTRAQVHDAYCLLSRGYRELFALEVECARLRKLIV